MVLKEDLIEQEISIINERLNEITSLLAQFNSKLIFLEHKLTQTKVSLNQTDIQHTKLYPTHNLPFKALKPINIQISTGNEGVPADRQTNQQTDKIQEKHQILPYFTSPKTLNIIKKHNKIEEAEALLDSLDTIKKEIRLKFKRLTDQEFLVFSAMYKLDEELGYSDYKLLSERLALTESSIRDYIGKLIKKGIPVDKNKINNKLIRLNISTNLKRILPLSTILQLRAI